MIMSSGVSHKGRVLKQFIPTKPRVRNESSDDVVPLDYRKKPFENFQEILTQSLNSLNCSKPIRLSYLNHFVRLLVRYPKTGIISRGFSQRELLICIRCLLVDDEREMRTAALRIIRYLINDESDFQEALRLKFDLLIVRCLDIVLDNHLERMQCVRLLSHLARICPHRMSPCMLRSLLAICSDGVDDNDKLTKVSAAILCELTVKRPEIMLELGDIGWLVRTILSCQSVRLAECLIGVLAYLINNPKYRRKVVSNGVNVYNEIFAPLIDPHFKLSGSDKDDKVIQLRKESDIVLENCRSALVAALKTWPGLIACLAEDVERSGDKYCFLSSPLQTVVGSLCLESEQIQEIVVDALCDVLNLPYKDEHWDTWDRTLELTDMPTVDDYQFSLGQNFVNADAQVVLPNWNSARTNLTLQMNSLVLCGLINAGLISSLLRLVIPNPNKSMSFKVLLVLMDLATQCSQFLPLPWKHLCHSIQAVLNIICDQSLSAIEKENARLIVNRLEILSDVRKRTKKPRTLQLELMMLKCKGNDQTLLPISTPKFDIHSVDRIHELIKDSRAVQPYSNYSSWDWTWIYLALTLTLDSRHALDDSICSKFIGQVLNFYDPQSGQFCKMSDDYKNYSRTGCVLMKVLGRAPHDSAVNAQLRGFLGQLAQALLPDRLHVGLLSTKNILSSSCADYFIFIGELSTTDVGRLALERTGIIQRLNDLLSTDNHENYAKLVISNFDYTKPGHGRCLLQKVLISSKEACRAYATEFLCVLGKLKINGFEDWGMDFLLNQLYDSDENVVRVAIRVLEELLTYDVQLYKSFFVSKRPSLLPLGDVGVILLTHLFSHEKTLSIAASQPSNFVENEIDRWKESFNMKYVEIVDELLHESVTNYQRLSSGHFPRHSSNRDSFDSAYLPHHLYGQLAKHQTGCQLLVQKDCVLPLVEILQFGSAETEQDVQQIKCALWALGHVGSTDCGYAVLPSRVTSCVIKIAEECPLYALRGVAFFCVNLLAQSLEGAEHLANLGWYTNAAMSLRQATSAVDRYTTAAKELSILQAPPGVAMVATDFIDDDAVSAVSGASSSLPPRIVSLKLPTKSSQKKIDSDGYVDGQKLSVNELCRLSVRSCVSCDLCRSLNANQQQSNSALVSPSSDYSSCPLHQQNDGFINGDGGAYGLFSSSAVTPPTLHVHCCSQSDTLAEEYSYTRNEDDMDDYDVVTTGSDVPAQRKTTRSKSLGATNAEEALRDALFLADHSLTADHVTCDDARLVGQSQSGSRPKASTLPGAVLTATGADGSSGGRRYSFDNPQSHKWSTSTRQDGSLALFSASSALSFNNRRRGMSFESMFSTEFRYKNIDFANDETARLVNESSVRLFNEPTKSLDTSNAHRRTLGLKKSAFRSRGLPLVGYSSTDGGLSGETVIDFDVQGLQRWRLLQTERVLNDDTLVVPPFQPDNLAEEIFSVDSPMKPRSHVTSNSLSPSVVCLPVDLNLICSLDVNVAIKEQQRRYVSVKTANRDVNSSNAFSRMKRKSVAASSSVAGKQQQQQQSQYLGLLCHAKEFCLLCDDVASSSIGCSSSLSTTSVYSDPTVFPSIYVVQENVKSDACWAPTASDRAKSTASNATVSWSIGLAKQQHQPKDGVIDENSIYVNESSFAAASAKNAGNRSIELLAVKETLRLVCLISVRKKYAEQGLLRLKQEVPYVFQSFCLYADVCYLMSRYNMRLAARRFLQDLFQDVNFSTLFEQSAHQVILDTTSNDKNVAGAVQKRI